MQPLLFDNEYIPHLKCPICGAAWTHQSTVEVYQRDDEDSRIGICSIVGDGRCIIHNKMDENPSGRRDGIRISFWCEQCSGIEMTPVFDLIIAQHKGETEMFLERIE